MCNTSAYLKHQIKLQSLYLKYSAFSWFPAPVLHYWEYFKIQVQYSKLLHRNWINVCISMEQSSIMPVIPVSSIPFIHLFIDIFIYRWSHIASYPKIPPPTPNSCWTSWWCWSLMEAWGPQWAVWGQSHSSPSVMNSLSSISPCSRLR